MTPLGRRHGPGRATPTVSSEALVGPVCRAGPTIAPRTAAAATLEKPLHRRAKELGDAVMKIEPKLETVVLPDGEVVAIRPDGEVVTA